MFFFFWGEENPFREVSFGEELFADIDRDEYLNELYENILYLYSRKLFRMPPGDRHPVNKEDALRFADLLSKSQGVKASESHMLWGQEIAALLNYIYPQDEAVQYYMKSILESAGNYQGLELRGAAFEAPSLLDRLAAEYSKNYLRIPAEPRMKFFPSQKAVYDRMGDQYFSYSGPTSMGKSFLMRMFIKQQIQKGARNNFAILVPTKALINEIGSKLIQELNNQLRECDYRVVRNAGEIVLDKPHNFIFVMTPERLMYLLISNPELDIDYLFIDEAHKISSRDKRSAFYYKVVSMLNERERKPHVIFAAPNVPNPEVYLELIPGSEYLLNNDMEAGYSPVSQNKFMVDLIDRTARIYNSHKKEFLDVARLKPSVKLRTIISYVGKDDQNLIYCSSKHKCINYALEYMEIKNPIGLKELEDLARDVKREVHNEYYLVELIRRGVAYHIGYLPADIRLRIEDYYRKGLIKTIFCTSTLIEGVNLPADNLFITSYKSGLAYFREVDFKNLMGRVGRLEYNLYGNVFIIRMDDSLKKDKFQELIEKEVPRQQLSIVTELTGPQKKRVIQSLLQGDVEFKHYPDSQSEDNYDLMRKFALILVRDILQGRSSRVRKEFAEYLDDTVVNTIKEQFSDKKMKPNDDISVSIDQTISLSDAIAGGLKYPELSDDHKKLWDDTMAFMKKLSAIFKWHIYERSTLGAPVKNGNKGILSVYTVILLQWMQGYGLSNIINAAIKDKKDKHGKVALSHGELEEYRDCPEHNNAIIADTLEDIDEVILFRISNYFLKFSEEYKRQHGNIKSFDNDWHEYVEYGTSNPKRILLQRSGFSREASQYILQHWSDYGVETQDGYHLNRSVLECRNELVAREAKDIQYNVPELFAE